MTSETYSITCVSPGCRYSRVCLRSEDEARELARKHGENGHIVEVTRETRRVIARYGEARPV